MDESRFLKEMGLKIKAIRNKKKVPLTHIHEMGVTDISNMSRIENGRVNPHLITLKKLADVLKCDVKDFL